ncbi:MAG: CoA transferase [Deltaproteobacteria bacterium]|nr:CoA transferase [Deltaproteobacteria bacterium]
MAEEKKQNLQDGALTGIKILDLSRTLPGPFCTLMLADMGAEVIKIQEARRRRNSLETLVPKSELTTDDLKAGYTPHRAIDRNKKGIALNLKNEAAREIFYKLVKDGDVVVIEFRPDVGKRLKIDYDTLKAINPRIIYCAVTAYGQDGPYADYPAHDANVIAAAGILGATGTPDGQYVLPGVPIADLCGGGMNAAVGILTALFAREKTGRGQFVDISMMDGAVAMMLARHNMLYGITGQSPKAGQRPSHVYRTRDDKSICFAGGEPWFWERLCKTLDLEELIPYDQAIKPFAGFSKEREWVISKLTEKFLSKTRDEWLESLHKADTCIAPVHTAMDDVLNDPQVKHRRMMVEVEDPILGKIPQPGIAIKLSETPGRIRTLAPRHGQHTSEILAGLGYSDEEVEELKKDGAVV